MADDKKYLDRVIDENDNTEYHLRDSELKERVDVLEEQIESSNDEPNSQSDVARAIININSINGEEAIRFWIGTQEQLDSLETFDSDVVYLVGTPTEGYIPDDTPTEETTYYTVTKSSLSHCYFNNNVSRVAEGTSFTGTFTAESGYTMDYVIVTMGGEDVTDDYYDSGTNTLSIDEVTGNIVITASANIPVTGISITRKTGQGTSNSIELLAILTPMNTTQTEVEWSIPSSNTDFFLTSRGLSATLHILAAADDSDVDVTCKSIVKPSITATYSVEDVTYVTPDPVDPNETPNEDEDYIDFTGETDIQSIILNMGCPNTSGKITKKNAKEWTPTKSACQAALKSNTSITQFNTWKYFENAYFNVSDCTNLASIELPYIAATSGLFSIDLGIQNIAITRLEIPEGYIQSELKAIKDNSNLKSIIFPNTYTQVNASQIIRNCYNVEEIEFGTDFTGSAIASGGKPHAIMYATTGATVKNLTFIFRGTTPPTNFIPSSATNNPTTTGDPYKNKVAKIYVPTAALSDYQNSPAFANYLDKLDVIEGSIYDTSNQSED